jgi:hypothetical protein
MLSDRWPQGTLDTGLRQPEPEPNVVAGGDNRPSSRRAAPDRLKFEQATHRPATARAGQAAWREERAVLRVWFIGCNCLGHRLDQQ